MLPKPTFEIVTTTAGVTSIRNNVVNEIMHNPVGPWREANALYIEQSQLALRLRKTSKLVVFDVGLGAAANALAAIHCARQLPNSNLHLISFERDLDLLRFALEHANRFEHFAGYEEAIQALLKNKIWQSQGLTWELREGDFLETIELEPHTADLVFFDPYSPAQNLEMWTIHAFQKLRKKCRESGDGALLLTYSRATPIRVALLFAGFFVGQGMATGLKEETTQASTLLAALHIPLGKSWLQRWNRSHKQNAFGAGSGQIEEIRQFVLQHPQFKN